MANSVRHLQPGYRFSGFHSDYEVLGPIGVKGGFGAVYKCKAGDIRQHEVVAVKFLADGGKQWMDRFRREVLILQRHHCDARDDEAGIPPVLDHGQVALSSSASAHFYVMPVIEGPEFPGSGSVVQQLRRVLAVAKRLERLHAEDQPLVHRDIKPSNILLGPELKTWLVDFGLAGQAGVDQTVTRTVGLGVGTKGFSAPEQFLSGDSIRELVRAPAVDVYSVGALVYYIVLSEMPFPVSTTLLELYFTKAPLPEDYRERLVEACREEDLPEAVAHAVHEALQPVPERRAKELRPLISALEEASGEPASAQVGGFSLELLGLSELDPDDEDEAVSAELVSLFEDAAPSVVNDLAPGVSLRSWQRDALEAWSTQENGQRGIVEAVTGAGKSRLGVEASRAHMEGTGGKAVVVVPSTALLRQWQRRFELLTPDLRVGRLGGGGDDTLRNADVLVCTIQSLAGLSVPKGALLVADECHRYGGLDGAALADSERKPGAWARALRSKPWGPRLGLSATVARSDGGHEDILRPVLGDVIYPLSFADVVRLQPVDAPWIAKMKLGFLRVPLGADEREDYDAYNGIMKKKRAQLVATGCPASPFGAFLACVQEKAAAGNRAAWSYLSNFSKRREMLANSPAKLDAMAELIPAIQAADRTIIFTEMVETASRCFDILAQHGVPAITVTKDTKSKTQVLSKFRRGVYAAIVAPKVLDEGIDVPAADLGIVVCGSRSKRQMIQRLGRVLRPKADGRVARFIFLVLKDTVEDPTGTGGSPEFIDEVRAARPVDERVFDWSELADVNAWLADYQAPGEQAQSAGGPTGLSPAARTDGSPGLNESDSEETDLPPELTEFADSDGRYVLENPDWEGSWERESLLPRSARFRASLSRLADEGIIIDPVWQDDRALDVLWPDGEHRQLFYLYGSGPWVDVEAADPTLYEDVHGGALRSGDGVVRFGWEQQDGALSLIRAVLGGAGQQGSYRQPKSHAPGGAVDLDRLIAEVKAASGRSWKRKLPSRAPRTGEAWEKLLADNLPDAWTWTENAKGHPVWATSSGLHVVRMRVYKRHAIARVRSRAAANEPSRLEKTLAKAGVGGCNAQGWFSCEWRVEDLDSFKELLDNIETEWA